MGDMEPIYIETIPVTRANAETVRELTEVATGRTWRRNGKTQTWKTRPTEFRIPVKFGMYGYGQITDLNAADFVVKMP